jgi:hypothetical protein
MSDLKLGANEHAAEVAVDLRQVGRSPDVRDDARTSRRPTLTAGR